MSVTKTITTSKPFYVVAGAGDLAVKTFRDGTDQLSALRIERKDIETSFASLQTETKALPAKAQTVAVTLAADVAGKVGTGYDELLGRGRSVVTRIRRQKSTQELQRQASTTVRRSKALVTTAKGAATDTADVRQGHRDRRQEAGSHHQEGREVGHHVGPQDDRDGPQGHRRRRGEGRQLTQPHHRTIRRPALGGAAGPHPGRPRPPGGVSSH